MNTRSWLEIGEEVEQPSGWAYRVARLDESGQVSSTHTVRLSWVDHDQFSGGACRPSVVVEAVLDALVEGGFEEWPAAFDISTARRWLPDLRSAVLERI